MKIIHFKSNIFVSVIKMNNDKEKVVSISLTIFFHKNITGL